tara:strand:+ start:97 stop:699 length:603 start_codon:yes stop_codon:yes gene_type:complete
MAMTQLGNGLYQTKQYEDALSVQEAELSIARRIGTSEANLLVTQGNLAATYFLLGRREDALRLKRDVYSGYLNLLGEEHLNSLAEAYNYGNSLLVLQRFKEAKKLMRTTIPVARRVLGENHEMTLRMRWQYAISLHDDDCATLADHREAVETLDSVAKSWKRVFGESHPETPRVQNALATAREKLADARAAASNKSKPPP